MQQSTEPIILGTEELKKKWDEFSKIFQELLEPSTNITAYSLVSLLGIREQNDKVLRILDLGCGGGGGSYLIASSMHKDGHLTSLDLSKEMIKLTEEKCQVLTQAPFNRKIDYVDASAEELPFEDETFDAVFSNYCLHLVPNPDKVLSEVSRVLKKSGRACFSVWGRPVNSPQFTVVPKVIMECKKEWGMVDNKPPVRSPFHLHDRDQLRERVLSRGFKTCLSWYQFQPFHALNAKEFTEVNVGTPDIRNLLQTVSEEQVQQFKTKMETYADEIYQSNNPMGNEVTIVIATKE